MIDGVLTKPERDALVARHREARARYNLGVQQHAATLGLPTEIGIDESNSAYVDTPAYQQARHAQREMVALEDEYFPGLPRLVMAPCPHCAKPLHRSFDPFGLDGLWWRSDAQPEEPQSCPHFCVLLGAVDLGNHRPRPDFDVHPGPGAPFVMPRLMGYAGMTAVVSELELPDGAIAFPVAYFAPRRPPAQILTASWARTNYVYTTQLGEHGWRRAEQGREGDGTWDFALGPWVADGRLRWCDPASDRTRLSERPAASCPYVDRPGTRTAQRVLRI